LRKIETRILRRAQVGETAETGVQVKSGCGGNYIGVAKGEAFAVGILLATIFTKTRAERILWQTEQLPVAKPAEKHLFFGNVLVHASYVLTDISTLARRCGEVICQRVARWQRKKAEQVLGRRVDAR
jgi:hypothetical protein